MTNPFQTYRDSYMIADKVNHPKVIVGQYSYYAGYYHGHDFMQCVRYLDEADRNKDCDKLVIGKFCSIASGVSFLMSGNQGHRADWISAYPLDILELERNKTKAPKGYLPKGDTVIGNDVWIGTEAMFMAGVTVGDGAIIAARAVVTKPVLPYTIVGGNPATTIRQRFSDEDIAFLLKLRWWDWDEHTIRQHMHLLRSGDVEGLKTISHHTPR